MLLGGGLVGGSAAEQRAKPLLIGALTEAWGPTPAIVGLRDGLVELGYRENEHFVLGIRFTEGSTEELPRAARQLVERGADILVTGGGGANEARALQQATDRVPIVFISGSDPVGTGLVQSFARPGGNVTAEAAGDLPGARHGTETRPVRLRRRRPVRCLPAGSVSGGSTATGFDPD